MGLFLDIFILRIPPNLFADKGIVARQQLFQRSDGSVNIFLGPGRVFSASFSQSNLCRTRICHICTAGRAQAYLFPLKAIQRNDVIGAQTWNGVPPTWEWLQFNRGRSFLVLRGTRPREERRLSDHEAPAHRIVRIE